MAIVITRHTAIKLLELILVLVLLGFHWNASMGDRMHQYLACGAFFGYLIILIGVFAGGLMGTPINRRVDLFYCLIGCILFIVVGIIWITKYGSGNDKVVGWLSVINGVIFLVDCVLVFRNEP